MALHYKISFKDSEVKTIVDHPQILLEHCFSFHFRAQVTRVVLYILNKYDHVKVLLRSFNFEWTEHRISWIGVEVRTTS